jgi:hydrogenase maturation protease
MNSVETEKHLQDEKPVLVIGYGNILRRDDGVGWAAARRLADQLPDDFASVMTVQQLLPELAEAVSHAKLVIFIDADAELSGGAFARRDLESARDHKKAIGHHQTPEGILRLAGHLYGHAPRALLYSIGGTDFSFGCALSRPVQVALREVVHEIVDAVVDYLPHRE